VNEKTPCGIGDKTMHKPNFYVRNLANKEERKENTKFRHEKGWERIKENLVPKTRTDNFLCNYGSQLS
jgi:hypothetical protein